MGTKLKSWTGELERCKHSCNTDVVSVYPPLSAVEPIEGGRGAGHWLTVKRMSDRLRLIKNNDNRYHV